MAKYEIDTPCIEDVLRFAAGYLILSSSNAKLYKQECISVLENDDIGIQLTDVFSIRLSEDIFRKKVLYECMEEHKDCICSNILDEIRDRVPETGLYQR